MEWYSVTLVRFSSMKFYTIFTQLFPPKSKYSVEEVPDLSGKTIIVTGANTGELLGLKSAWEIWSSHSHRTWKGDRKGMRFLRQTHSRSNGPHRISWLIMPMSTLPPVVKRKQKQQLKISKKKQARKLSGSSWIYPT